MEIILSVGYKLDNNLKLIAYKSRLLKYFFFLLMHALVADNNINNLCL